MSTLKRKADFQQHRLTDHVQADELASLKATLLAKFKERSNISRAVWYEVPDDSSLELNDSDKSDGESNDDTTNDESKVAADLANVVDEILEELLRYLYLLGHYKCDGKSVKLSPSDIVDEAFHILLLNPVLYHKVCDFILNLLGQTAADRPIHVLPHNLDDSDDQCARARRLQLTSDFYSDVFPHDAPEHIWGVESPGFMNAATCDFYFVPFKDTPTDEHSYNIMVKTMTGKTIAIRVGSVSEAVGNLKYRIRDKEGIPPEQQPLIFAGQRLENERLLSSYGIRENSVVHLALNLRGC